MNLKIGKKNKGFTLIEVMVALTIFSIIALFTVDIFISVMRYYIASVANRTAQQDSKIALETITRYVKQATTFDWNLSEERLTLKTKDDQGVVKYVIFDKDPADATAGSNQVIKTQIKDNLSDSDNLESLTSDDLNINLFEVNSYPGIPVILGIYIEAEIENQGKNIERGITGGDKIIVETRVAIKGQYNF